MDALQTLQLVGTDGHVVQAYQISYLEAVAPSVWVHRETSQNVPHDTNTGRALALFLSHHLQVVSRLSL
jgi:hypothetical protein